MARTRLIFCYLLTTTAFIMAITACDSHPKQSINVAVASNFESTLNQLIPIYMEQNPSNPEITVIPGSSGVLANQVLSNAPFDIFLSADLHKPQHLQTQLALKVAPQIYATGQLQLWIPKAINNGNCLSQLSKISSLVIANPQTAPYGFVAQKILNSQDIGTIKIIQTSNVSQAYLYTKDQLVEAGFVARSMIKKTDQGCQQTFDDELLNQGMLLINPQAKAFYDFMLSKKTQSLIKQAGYRTQL